MKNNSLLGVFLLCCLTGVALAAEVSGKRLAAADGEPGNWLAHGRNYGEERYSPLRAINVDTVDKLDVKHK